MTGSEEDPENGAAVAGTIFTAVIVYAVSHTTSNSSWGLLTVTVGILRLLWFTGITSSATIEQRGDIIELAYTSSERTKGRRA